MKFKVYFIAILFFVSATASSTASAKDLDVKWSDLRLFFNESTIANNSQQLEALLVPDSIPPKKKLVGFGMEAVAEVNSILRFGAKFKGVFQSSNKEEAPFPATHYLAIQQYHAGLTGRMNIINSEKVLFDVFVEAGLSNNRIKVVATAGTAEWNKDQHFYQRAGSSLGFGGKDMKIFIEGGYENLKLDGLSHTGTIGSNITEIDLSGTFVGVGLVIAGIPDWITPRAISSK